MSDHPALFETLSELLGARFSRTPAILDAHGHGESYHASRDPDAVVFPTSTEEVSQIVKLCFEAGVPVTPFGAGTSLEGNCLPVQGGITVDLSQMTRVIAIHDADLDCVVEAGVTREQLNTHLRDSGLFFPIDPGANASIGGMASTRASGTNAVRYGTMRENVLALTVVLPSGEIVLTASRARKSAAGYDLTRMFIGAEGTLGIITEITLRLYGIPESMTAALCRFETVADAVNTAIGVIQLGVPVAKMELLDPSLIAAVNRHSKLALPEQPTLAFEFHGSPRAVEEQVETVRDVASDQGAQAFEFATSAEERTRLWRARHQAFYAVVGQRPGARGWSSDVCVPISRLAECVTYAQSLVAECPVPGAILGHVGDGNFHVVFALDPDNSEEVGVVTSLSGKLVKKAIACEGTCTGEHGVGIGKIGYLPLEFGNAVDVMRQVKDALDPLGLMNPGKLFQPR